MERRAGAEPGRLKREGMQRAHEGRRDSDGVRAGRAGEEAAAEGNEWGRDGTSGEARRLMAAYGALVGVHRRLAEALCRGEVAHTHTHTHTHTHRAREGRGRV
jgi:hypothetical protein